MEVEYRLTLADWDAFSRHHHAPGPRTKVAYWVFRLLCVGVGLTLFIAPFYPPLAERLPEGTYRTVRDVCLGGVLVAVVFLVQGLRSHSALRRQLHQGHCGEMVRLSISLEGLSVAKKFSRSAVDWPGVRRIVRTSEHVFLYIGHDDIFIVPKRVFAEDTDWDFFVREAERYWREATSDAGPAPTEE